MVEDLLKGYLHEPWVEEEVVVVLEFQSRPDPFMALRLWVYVGLLLQDLVRRGELAPERRLPPVLPLVLYNGRQRWSAQRIPYCFRRL
jgi:hypothetical protein